MRKFSVLGSQFSEKTPQMDADNADSKSSSQSVAKIYEENWQLAAGNWQLLFVSPTTHPPIP
jgi:hypothetical protein